MSYDQDLCTYTHGISHLCIDLHLRVSLSLTIIHGRSYKNSDKLFPKRLNK